MNKTGAGGARLFANIISMKLAAELARRSFPAEIYLLKGTAVMTFCAEAVSKREAEDIDILVAGKEERRMVESNLAVMGFVKRRRDPQTYENIAPCAKPFDLHDGLWYASGRSLSEILARAVRAKGFPPNAKIFAPDDLAADIMIHSFQHGFADGKWRDDLSAVRRRFGPRAVSDGLAKAARYCPGLSLDAPPRNLPSSGFIGRFAALGTPKKKAAYAAAVMFPPVDFIARRYDCSSPLAGFLYGIVRPLEICAAGLRSSAAVFSSRAAVNKRRRLPA